MANLPNKIIAIKNPEWKDLYDVCKSLFDRVYVLEDKINELINYIEIKDK